VRKSLDEIAKRTAQVLARHGLEAGRPALMPIEPPRDWGLSTNVCFALAPRVAKDEIELRTDGLGKKEKKQLAAQITREVGAKLAEELAAELAPLIAAGELPFVARVEAEGAYVNFYYDAPALTAQLVSEIVAASDPDDSQVGRPSLPAIDLADASLYGRGAPTGRRIMVEYAQPNTHKDFHVGHLRNASIGQAIANLLAFAGNAVLKATYIGDVGLHVAKSIVGHLKEFGGATGAGANRLGYWGECYKAVHSRFDDDPQLAEEVRTWLREWESRAVDQRQQWQSSRDECIAAFHGIFDELLVGFDDAYTFFESTIDDSKLGQQTAAELKQLGIAEVDQSEEYKGALYVDFERQADALRPDGTPVFRDDEKKRIRRLGKLTILRSDGTSLYQTKELGLAKHKFDLVREKYGRDLDESLYVVGAEQQLYFQQVFAILRLWGFKNAEHCRHISYELVVLPEGKMSSREGSVVSYRELRDEAIRRAEQLAREKGIGSRDESGAIDEDKVKAIARDVAIAAIKYAMLQVTGSQQIVFDFEQALSFSGRAAPYLQYAYARAGKLVADDPGGAGAVGAKPRFANGGTGTEAETGRSTASPLQPGYELHESEIALARVLGEFPDVCAAAAAACEPATLCTYLYDLATAFSDFYRDCRVLDAPEPERGFRRALTAAFRRVLRSGFQILALPLPEEM